MPVWEQLVMKITRGPNRKRNRENQEITNDFGCVKLKDAVEVAKCVLSEIQTMQMEAAKKRLEA